MGGVADGWAVHPLQTATVTVATSNQHTFNMCNFGNLLRYANNKGPKPLSHCFLLSILYHTCKEHFLFCILSTSSTVSNPSVSNLHFFNKCNCINKCATCCLHTFNHCNSCNFHNQPPQYSTTPVKSIFYSAFFQHLQQLQL